ncbi:hypothetical protein KAR91_72390 [Candidatus Pacearchaeota archaeon]|nr:hypothetical protein [Candidatus Pacearchaeota archaeon]
MSEKNKKLYKISAPVGNLLMPKEQMNEEELRDFFPQVVQEPEMVEVWKEKAAKDPVKDLVEILQRAGYIIEIIE